jgi:cell shape-determining protein MreC
MMKNKKLIYAVLIIIAILAIIGVSLFVLNKLAVSPKIIIRSVPQGDFVVDTRSPIEACNSIIQEVQDHNPNLNCRLIDSKRIDSSDDWGECVDGVSKAGCFTCTFECK